MTSAPTSTQSIVSCIACQCEEEAQSTFSAESSSPSPTVFVSLLPCSHILCKECYQSPLVLVSCYGCPACGSKPTDYREVSRSVPGAVSEKKKIAGGKKENKVDEMAPETISGSSFTQTSSSAFSMFYYPSTTTSAGCTSYIEQYTPNPVHVTPLDNLPLSSFSSSSHAQYRHHYRGACDQTFEFAEEEDSDSGLTTSTATTPAAAVGAAAAAPLVDDASSAASAKKRRRQKKKRPTTHADKFPKVVKVSVVVPKGCPDNERPRSRPDPRTCREAGRRYEREHLLHSIFKAKEHQKRRNTKMCRGMAIF